MNTLGIDMSDGRKQFIPGETLSGTIWWRFDDTPEALELRLFWYTRGKGDVDVGLVDTLRVEQPAPETRRQFSFTLPDAPYSFSGGLISLVWALELVADPGGETDRVEFAMSPPGEEIVLGVAVDLDDTE